MSYELYFDKQPTGRTHQVNAGGTIQMQQILGADGQPEQEYVLGAIVDGHAVPLQTFSVGYVEHMASRPDTELSGDTSSSSAPATDQPAQTDQPAAAPAAGDEPAAGDQPQAPPADQPAG